MLTTSSMVGYEKADASTVSDGQVRLPAAGLQLGGESSSEVVRLVETIVGSPVRMGWNCG